MMRFDIISIFPNIFSSYLNESILKRAQKKGLIQIKIHNLRDFAKNKPKRHRRTPLFQQKERNIQGRVDDRPYGGGPGMVFKIEPLIKAIDLILKIKNAELKIKKKTKIILFSPTGKQFNNKLAAQLAKNYNHLILICGRYEGIDARVEKIIKDLKFKIENLSLGPYVLTGGELPAMVLIDAVSRQIPEVLGNQESIEEKRFGSGVPVYTRPEVFVYKEKKYAVPKILLSGNHQKIAEWRKKHKKII